MIIKEVEDWGKKGRERRRKREGERERGVREQKKKGVR